MAATPIRTVTCPPLNRNQFQSASQRMHRLTRITRSQPASGLRRQPELCQQAAEETAQDGVAVSLNAVGMVSG